MKYAVYERKNKKEIRIRKTIEYKMLTEEDKEILKRRINSSVEEYRRERRKKRIVYSLSAVAATIAVLLSVTNFSKTSEIQNYVNVNDVKIDQEGDVKLVLNNNEEITIEERESSITYSTSGDRIAINDNESIEQSSKDSYNTIIVPYGKRTYITLSEGTKVWLNSGSKLTYPVAFTGDKREVHLIGEAIFDVTHNKQKPFYVITNDYDIKVLGTVFNVSSYQDDAYTSTALEQGSVEIKYATSSIFGKSRIKIKPGTLAVYNNQNKSIQSRSVDVSKYMSWRDGKFIFKKERLDVIVKKLSRYYNVSISIKNEALKKETFSGHLDLKDNIDKVLEIISETTDLKFEKEKGRVVIN